MQDYEVNALLKVMREQTAVLDRIAKALESMPVPEISETLTRIEHKCAPNAVITNAIKTEVFKDE